MKHKKGIWLSVCVAALLLVVLAVGMFARYIRSTEDVKNTFKPAEPTDPVVVETFEPDRNVKENVKFSVGDPEYPVYVRATILITWKHIGDETNPGDSDYIYFEPPVRDKDYTLALNEYSSEVGDNWTGWTLGSDGYYYYVNADKQLQSVESGGETGYLINRCEQINFDTEYTLSVEIIVQTVQAVGTTDADVIDAWMDAWKSADEELAPTQPAEADATP